jgi:predicted permease
MMKRVFERLARWVLGKADFDVLQSEMEELYRERIGKEGKEAADRWLQRERQRAIKKLISVWGEGLSHVGSSPVKRKPAKPTGLDTMHSMIRGILGGFRGLSRTPMFALTMVGTLAIGIGGMTAVVSVVHGVMLQALPYHEPSELVRLSNRIQGRDLWFSAADYFALEEQRTLFEGVAAMEWHRATFTSDEKNEAMLVHSVTPGFFPLLGIEPVHGRTFTEEEGLPGTQPSALVSWGFWNRELGGDPAAVGSSIRLDGVAVPVVGVLPRNSGPLLEDLEILVPLKLEPPTRRGPFFLVAFGRLAGGVEAAAATAELEAIHQRMVTLWRNSPDRGATWAMRGLKDYVLGDLRTPLLVLLGAAFFVLLMVSTNGTSLTLARLWDRRQELAVRAALGASRRNLVRHLLTESVIIAILGAGAGLVFAAFGIRLAVTAGSAFLPRTGEVGLTGPVLLLFALTSVGSLALFGLLPALQGSRTEIGPDLQEGGARATSVAWRQRTQNLLAATQFAVTVPVLIGAGLLLVSFAKLARVDTGFDVDRVLALDVAIPVGQVAYGEELTAFWKDLLGDLKAIPGVVEAGVGRGRPPSRPPMSNNFVLEDQPVGEGQSQPIVPWVFASTEYMDALGSRLLAGRVFDPVLDESQTLALVDEAWARRFYDSPSHAVGRRFMSGSCTSYGCPWTTVIGVVEELRYSGLKASNPGVVFLNAHAYPSFSSTLLIRAQLDQDPSTLIPTVRETVRRANVQAAISRVASGKELLQRNLRDPKYLAVLVGSFGAISFLLAILGIYGVMERFVRHHRREIGIRIALGGASESIVGLVLRRGMTLVILGSVVGLGGAAVLTRFMGAILFEVGPTDPLVVGSSLAAVIVVATLACWGPALRAANVAPREVLAEG